MNVIKLSLLIVYCLKYELQVITCTNLTNLKQLHVVFRHGERSPSELYPNDPYSKFKWPDGLGYLTNTGKLQMYELGKKIREKYGSFITDYYFPNDVKILSSYSDRCLMSAQLFTSGLFIPKYEQIWNTELPWQPIPLSYKPRDQDNMIAAKQNCTKYDEIYKELFHTPKYIQILEDNSDLFEYLTQNTGENVTTIRKVEELYNTLEIEKLNNLTLPEWTETVFPKKMMPLATLSLSSFTETEFMKRMKGGPFIKKMLEDMRRGLHIQNNPKLFIYSAHDLTLVNILRTLNLTDQIKPGFAANLVFELYDTSQTEIKVIYSNCGWCEYTEFNIKNCQSPCTLDALETVLKPVIPTNWTEECNR